VSVAWFHKFLLTPKRRRWLKLPVRVHINADLPDSVVDVVGTAVININAKKKRSIIVIDKIGLHADIRIRATAGQVATTKTILVEHVEKGTIESVTIALGEPVLRAEDLRVRTVVRALTAALGASSRRQLNRLYP
jgi:hypothetical protein